ncbi:MAG: DUF222 domain-containing protein [Sporichthyaceae bacterium]
MTHPQPLPLDLAASSSLPELAALMDEIEPGSVCGFDTVEVLRAAQRLANAADAAKFAWVVEVAIREPGSVSTVRRLQCPHEHAVDEIRAGLGISATAAGRLLSAAWDAVRRLPDLHAAMAAGGLDEQRAGVFAEWTLELSDSHAHAVVAELLPRAVLDAGEQLPAHLLIKEITALAMALDPAWAERRFKESLRRRRVVGRANPDGTADVSGQNLEPHRAAAMCGRLTDLARAAKHDGDPRPIDHIRVELYCGMLDGTYEGLTDTEIFAALAATRPTLDEPNAPAADSDDAPVSDTPSFDAQATPASDADDSPAPAPTPARRAESPQAGVQLRIRMTTLLGLDRTPAELAGWTPISPDYALDLAALMTAAQWRYALTDDDGHVVGTGLITTRPKGWRRRSARHRGIVDVLVPASLLRDLVVGPLNGIELVDPEQYRSWHPVLTELAHLMRHPKRLPDDSDRRMPGRGLRRAVELDKPRCIGVGCGRPARRCEIDHRHDWAKGGRTVGVNLAPGCGRDHALKTKGGWTLHTWTPHAYRWCTPLGRHYVVSVPPVIGRLPAAQSDFWIADHNDRPDPDAAHDHEGIPWQASRIWKPAGPLPPPAVDLLFAASPKYPDDPPF